VTQQGQRSTGFQHIGQDPAGIGVDGEVLHRAVAAWVEHHVIVVRIDIG